jgi:hypothetical protein
MKVREELLGPPEMVSLGVMEATKTARTFVAAVKVFLPQADKEGPGETRGGAPAGNNA